MKKKIKFIISLILFIIGILSIIFALIMQAVLCYQKFGAVFENSFIPHWSAYFFFGVIPLFLSFLIIELGGKNGKKSKL